MVSGGSVRSWLGVDWQSLTGFGKHTRKQPLCECILKNAWVQEIRYYNANNTIQDELVHSCFAKCPTRHAPINDQPGSNLQQLYTNACRIFTPYLQFKKSRYLNINKSLRTFNYSLKVRNYFSRSFVRRRDRQVYCNIK